MIDDSDRSGGQRTAEELLYDYFKHMTSISLVALGGVLTISQLPDADPKPFSLGFVTVLLALSGGSGFAGMDEIVRSRVNGRDTARTVRLYRRLCPIAFGVGVGAFLAMFFNALY